MNSTISWIDSSPRERELALALASALDQPSTLDDLGIGTIRDTLADALFPGTTTIQTRGRYFLSSPGSCRWPSGRGQGIGNAANAICNSNSAGSCWPPRGPEAG